MMKTDCLRFCLYHKYRSLRGQLRLNKDLAAKWSAREVLQITSAHLNQFDVARIGQKQLKD